MENTFWDRTAKIYDRFMRKDHKVYKQMYAMIFPVVRHKTVLELATGTGLIAKQSFDVVIVSNALYIVPEPEKALAEMQRVLKDDGVLIAPTFTHDGNTLRGKIKVFFMKLAGFPLYSKWSSTDYLAFLQSNGWSVRKTAVPKASFPLTYAECVKEES